MSNELTVRDPINLTPAEVVENATVQAKLLMDIVTKTGCFQEISGKKYLQVEAWETIGAFNRTHAETIDVDPIIKDGETIGYQARVQLWKDGISIGGAVMPCYFTENCCKGKEGDAKHKACMSAAQTFATSKAYRMNYSYVAILAGYQATPAEEMMADTVPQEQATKEHWCAKHNKAWFKTPKMRNYAHPIAGSKDWCAEPVKAEGQAQAVENNAPATATSPAVEPTATAVEETAKRDPATIKSFPDLYNACNQDFKLKSKQAVWKELNVNSQEEISDTPAECYARLASVR